MAKGPKPPAALKPRTRVRKAARLILGDRLNDTWSRAKAARAGEPEAGIHQMRVAAKRLREAMRLFSEVYDEEAYAVALREVDSLNDHLGAVRDLDVLQLALRGRAELAPAVVDELCAELAAERDIAQAALVVEFDRLRGEEFLRSMRDIIWTGRHPRRHAVAGMRIMAYSRAAIGVRIRPVIKRLGQVNGKDDADGLHRVRVANKKLRYAIEPFLDLYGRRLRDAFSRVTELHETLGDLHDIDVLLERIDAFAAANRRKTAAKSLRRAVVDERELVFERVHTFAVDGAAETFGRMIADAID